MFELFTPPLGIQNAFEHFFTPFPRSPTIPIVIPSTRPQNSMESPPPDVVPCRPLKKGLHRLTHCFASNSQVLTLMLIIFDVFYFLFSSFCCFLLLQRLLKSLINKENFLLTSLCFTGLKNSPREKVWMSGWMGRKRASEKEKVRWKQCNPIRRLSILKSTRTFQRLAYKKHL